MKKKLATMLLAIATIAFCVSDLNAQRQGNPASRMTEMLKRFPIVSALDANGDGEISETEIENAVAALQTLDKDGDGSLNASEMLPEMGGMQSGRGQRGRTSRTVDGLKVGEVAPTFKLKSLDGDSETDLSDFKGKKPVVLFFGSYT